MVDQPDADRTQTLIAYVRGDLPEADAERLSREAASDPALAAEIALMRGVAMAVEHEAAQPAPGELGWARLSRALDAQPRQPQRSWRPLWQLAAAAGVAVVLWQAVAVPLLRPGDEAGYRPVSEQPAGMSVQVGFAPDAPELAIRELVREVGAHVGDGPSAIGLWRLDFASAAARDAGLQRLQASPIVESAQVD